MEGSNSQHTKSQPPTLQQVMNKELKNHLKVKTTYLYI